MPVDVLATVNALAWMLFGAAILAAIAARARLPYAVALVIGGVVAEETHLLALPQLDPNILLFVFLPPLLFDAAFRLDDRELRAMVRPVLLLAVPGTIATAAIVASISRMLRRAVHQVSEDREPRSVRAKAASNHRTPGRSAA